MLERMPTVMGAQEVLDKAFHKASRIDIPDPVKYHRVRKEIMARVRSASDTVHDTLRRYTKAVPPLDEMRDYEREVIDVLVGLGEMRKAVTRVDWAANKARELAQEHEQRGLRLRSTEGFHNLLKRHYGRLSSVVADVDDALRVLADARDRLRMLPTVSPEHATVVVAGFPNVGKTSLLRSWTASRARVDEYPFTTQHAEVGHLEVPGRGGRPRIIQVVDTPGLLDRPDEERNEIERQATAALRFAADAVLFLIDPTEGCGHSVEEQEALLRQVEREMAGMPLVVAETKADLARTPTVRLRFSTTTGEGMERLQQAVLDALPPEGEVLEADPMDRWRAIRGA